MMIPQIPRRLIKTYLDEADKVILDPYCGSGTTLVEANLSGRSGIGIDINPLALMIAKAKVTGIDQRTLVDRISELPDIKPDDGEDDNEEVDYWFAPKVASVLRSIKTYIEQLDDPDIRQFFTVAFSETIRDVSYVNKGGYKRHRMKDIEAFHPDVAKLMRKKLDRNAIALGDFMEATKDHEVSNSFLDCNTVDTIDPLRDRQIDGIITSPPYGDSRTTVAYGEFSSFSLQWLGYDTKGLDRSLMGGGNQSHDVSMFPTFLNEIIVKIASADAKRADVVSAFYDDYRRSIDNVATLLKPGAIAAYVVGNRIVKDQKLPTDKITAYFFEQNGYEHVDTIIRSIPNKRMPRSNSPSNIAGMTVSTMNEEYIVVMRKR